MLRLHWLATVCAWMPRRDVVVVAVWIPSVDHFTQVIIYEYTTTSNAPEPPVSQIDWAKALKSTSLVSYQQEVSSIISPLLGRPYSCPDDLNAEICSVSQRLYSASLKTYPHRAAPKKKNQWFKDQCLARLASRKKAAWDEWAANGRPVGGPLYDAKIKTRADFRKRMKICIAAEERK